MFDRGISTFTCRYLRDGQAAVDSHDAGWVGAYFSAPAATSGGVDIPPRVQLGNGQEVKGAEGAGVVVRGDMMSVCFA